MDNRNDIELRIKFIDGAFDAKKEAAELHDCKKYTKHVAEMNKAAEAVDRYDEFASLSLSPSDYAKNGGEYGIAKSKFHIGNERLLPHQVKATSAFLKELRGFGLLADVVGSGKTYEACAVLSELSAKGKINSALIIVPSQVYSTWVEVLEMNFGLGKDVLCKMDGEFNDENFTKGSDGIFRPNKPIIVKSEEFIKWKEYDVENVLFDVVVVDEAHNLCGEEGSSARALKLLSILMLTKKKAQKTFCVLLSATPHSGNLNNMFRLWYFIRCKGGVPEDFDEKDDEYRTEEYKKEKNYYKEHICRGAITVMEFINNVKLIEVTGNYGDKFEEYLDANGIADFKGLLEGEKKKIVEDFLNENEDIKAEVIRSVANAYHNGVLRSIMIRQPNDRIRKGKRIENVFFFPATGTAGIKSMTGLKGEAIKVDTVNLYSDQAIIVNGDKFSLNEYVDENRGSQTHRAAYARLFFDGGILNTFGLTEDSFTKKGSLRFYWNQLQMIRANDATNAGNEIDIKFHPVFKNDVLEQKLLELKRILRQHANGRVIIFFDYDIKKSERCYQTVLDELKKDAEFASRIIVGDGKDNVAVESAFNEKEDTVLIVTNSSFTEGANLQKSNVIVNFQITPNPLAMEQRIGRIFRLGQENDVTIYSLADMTKLEGYVLMYFTRIGLMTSNSGDAAIIAGSNNDNMVTIRCSACGRVKLLSREDYEAYKKNDSDEIYCNTNEACKQHGARGMTMEEINSNEEKCDNCGSVIRRQEDGRYYCLSISSIGSGIMCNSGEKGDRELYCHKICAIAHCERFISGAMAGKCEALEYYKANPNASEACLEELCDNCQSANVCYKKCRLGTSSDAIKGCMTCSEATCFPKPHVLNFDNKWETECPVCKENGTSGRLRPVVARTFETYVRSAYDYQQDGGKSFCENLGKEASKVAQIQAILANDEVRK